LTGFYFFIAVLPNIFAKSTKLSTSTKLSAVIITYNEIEYIEECLNSVLFADQIIVVDSFSDDGTWEYLKSKPKVTAIQHPFENFTKQKSFALSQATNDWVYFFDADERVTPALQKEIIATINNPNSFDAYWNYRSLCSKTSDYILVVGKPIRSTAFFAKVVVNLQTIVSYMKP